uniref:Uncharacterized protein n=1 Tax=Mus musculus TaxID=10090 RepID=Q8CAU1_MOUSE|nr:unnamed protein product [Mus musculus]
MSPSSSSSSSSSMFSRTFLVIICMSPGDRHSAALGSARLRSARAASSALPSRHCPAALRPRSASAGAAQPATEHAQRDAAAPAPDQTAPAARSLGGSRAGGVGGRGVAEAGRAAPRLRGALQPQRQAGFYELTRVFNLQNDETLQGARLVWGRKTTHVRTESPCAPARRSTCGEWSRGALQAPELGRTKHAIATCKLFNKTIWETVVPGRTKKRKGEMTVESEGMPP